jgi:hypothetical protein
MMKKNILETLKKVERAVEFIAANKVIKLSDPTATDFDNECGKIERCVEYHYRNSKSDMEFNLFALTFLKEHAEDFIFTHKYDDMYISDVPNPKQITKEY